MKTTLQIQNLKWSGYKHHKYAELSTHEKRHTVTPDLETEAVSFECTSKAVLKLTKKKLLAMDYPAVGRMAK